MRLGRRFSSTQVQWDQQNLLPLYFTHSPEVSYVYSISIFQSVVFRLLYFYLWKHSGLGRTVQPKVRAEISTTELPLQLWIRSHPAPLGAIRMCIVDVVQSIILVTLLSSISPWSFREDISILSVTEIIVSTSMHMLELKLQEVASEIELHRLFIRFWTTWKDSNCFNIEITAVIESQSTDLKLIEYFSGNEQAGKTLSPRAWNAAFNDHGQLKLDKVLKRVRRGVRDLLHHLLNFCFCTRASIEVVIVIFSFHDDVLHQPW